MAAAIQHAAGGALLGAASSPAAADFAWRAVAAAAPRLMRLMNQRHVSSSAPRALHILLHRPASGATKQQMPPAVMGAASAGRSFSTNDKSKYTNQLQEEEAKMKRKKALAEALMHDLPTSSPGAKDHGAELKGISHLFGLLDVADTTAPTASVDDEQAARKQVAELLSKVEKGKHSLLIELLGDGPNRDQKKAELVDAGRRLRDALAAQDERRAFQNLFTELKSLQQRVATAEYTSKTLSEKVAAGRLEVESANANAKSIRADVSRLGLEVTSMKKEAKAVDATSASLSTKVEKLEESVAQSRKEAESAYGLSLFLGFSTVVAAFTALVLM